MFFIIHVLEIIAKYGDFANTGRFRDVSRKGDSPAC